MAGLTHLAKHKAPFWPRFLDSSGVGGHNRRRAARKALRVLSCGDAPRFTPNRLKKADPEPSEHRNRARGQNDVRSHQNRR
jgi:hypothetical protein